MAGRTFTQLKKKMNIRKLNWFCREFATEYAWSGADKSEKYFTETYDVSRSCYAKIKDYAVVHCLVSEHVVSKMEKKARINQKVNADSNGYTTTRHYQELRKKRRKFLYDLAKEYTESKQSTYKLIESHGRSAVGYFYMIAMTFIGDYGVDYEMARKINIRLIKDCPSQDKIGILSKLCSRLWEERNTC